jgi:hypothetical protein
MVAECEQIRPENKPDRKQIGPYTGAASLAKLDGRRKEARLMRAMRDELVAHIGGAPSVIERRLIDRAAVLALRLAIMDARAPDGRLSEKDAREYLAWSNSYVRTLRELGVKSPPEPEKTVDELLAAARAGGSR